MLKDKVVIVTGASAGLGKDFATALIQEGATVYACARRLDKMNDLKKMGIYTVKMDITQDADIVQVVEKVIKEQGRIDCLINNAGYGVYGSAEEVSLNDARQQFEVNLFGLARITQLCLPHMREKKSGRIINISSAGGKVYSPMGSWYHASKYALEGWSDTLRLEVAKFNIDVVLIEPGLIQTEFMDVMINPLVKRSSSGPYAGICSRFIHAFQNAMKFPSKPSVITELVLHAAKAPKPKTRYVAGKFAHIAIFFRWLLSDRLLDRLIMIRLK